MNCHWKINPDKHVERLEENQFNTGCGSKHRSNCILFILFKSFSYEPHQELIQKMEIVDGN